MVFVYRIPNYRAPHHFVHASVHDETVLRLRPFLFAFSTFSRILQLQRRTNNNEHQLISHLNKWFLKRHPNWKQFFHNFCQFFLSAQFCYTVSENCGRYESHLETHLRIRKKEERRGENIFCCGENAILVRAISSNRSIIPFFNGFSGSHNT